MLPMILGIAMLIAGPGDETAAAYADPGAVYALQDIDGAAFDATATIVFDTPGQIAGRAPCNTYTAAQDAPYPWFAPGPPVVTQTACPDLAAEATFLSALAAMTLIEVSGPVLILSAPDGSRMTFQTAPPN